MGSHNQRLEHDAEDRTAQAFRYSPFQEQRWTTHFAYSAMARSDFSLSSAVLRIKIGLYEKGKYYQYWQ